MYKNGMEQNGMQQNKVMEWNGMDAIKSSRI